MSRSEQIRPGTPDRSMERWGPANWTIVVQECSGRKKGLNCIKKYCNFRCYFSLLRHSLISEVFDIVAVSVLIVVNYCKPFSTLTHWFVCNFWKTLTQFCPKKIWYSVTRIETRKASFPQNGCENFFPPEGLEGDHLWLNCYGSAQQKCWERDVNVWVGFFLLPCLP